MGDYYRNIRNKKKGVSRDSSLIEYLREVNEEFKEFNRIVGLTTSSSRLQRVHGEKRKKERLALIKKYGGRCEECGERDTEVLVFHHLSYNPEKLKLLCANCHMRLHRSEELKRRKKKTVRKLKRRLRIGDTG